MNYFILGGIVVTLLLSILTYFFISKDSALKTSRMLLIFSVILLGVSGVLLVNHFELVSIVLLVLSLVLIIWATKDISIAGYNSKWLSILGVISGLVSLGLLISQQLNIKLPSFPSFLSLPSFTKEVKKDFVIVEKPKEIIKVEDKVQTIIPTEVCSIRQVTPKFDASLLLSQMCQPSQPSQTVNTKLEEVIKSRSFSQPFSGEI